MSQSTFAHEKVSRNDNVTITPKLDTGVEKKAKSAEEYDCDRRGFVLTKTVLGTGAYATVKLAYISNAKLERDRRLATELKIQGTNKVSLYKIQSIYDVSVY